MIRPTRTETVLAAFSIASVVVVGAARLGWITLAGSVGLSLYPLYSFAAAAGWVLGNLYVRRIAGVARRWRWLLAPFYLLLPVGPLFLLRSMAPLAAQQAQPLVPWFCVGVATVLFAVPVMLRPRRPARRPRIGRD